MRLMTILLQSRIIVLLQILSSACTINILHRLFFRYIAYKTPVGREEVRAREESHIGAVVVKYYQIVAVGVAELLYHFLRRVAQTYGISLLTTLHQLFNSSGVIKFRTEDDFSNVVKVNIAEESVLLVEYGENIAARVLNGFHLE